MSKKSQCKRLAHRLGKDVSMVRCRKEFNANNGGLWRAHPISANGGVYFNRIDQVLAYLKYLSMGGDVPLREATHALFSGKAS